MKKTTTVMNALFIAMMANLIFQTSCSSSGQKSPDKRDMVVWYNKPADMVWLDGLFIGNGYMGANIFGKVQNERIALNESTFWSGRPHDYDDPDANKYFGKIKDLVFANKFKEAEKMVNEHFYGNPTGQQAYQPIGDLLLNFNVTGDSIKDYRRELDMETGVVRVSYTEGNVKMTREVFMSYPDRVMVMKVSANKPGRVSLEAKLKSPFLEKTTAKEGKLIIDGTWKYLPKTDSWLIAKVEGTGLNFQTSLIAMPEKGIIESTDSSIVIKKANSVTFMLTIATSFVNYKDISGNPASSCEKIMAGVNGKDFNALKDTHIKDFTGLMGRVHLKIGDPVMNQKPTDERIANLKKGQSDPDLLAKLFNLVVIFWYQAAGQAVNRQICREGGMSLCCQTGEANIP